MEKWYNLYGGLGSAIAETLMKSKLPIVPVGIKDRFGQSAKTYEALLAEYGITKETICDAVQEVLTLK